MSFLECFIYIDCFLIVISVLFTMEKSIIDIFSEQYGNHKTQFSEVFLNRFISILVFVYLVISYFYLRDIAYSIA
ncbi:MAG: hypothetical protein Q8781_01965 [Candidatus Phytoplasma stylosanthis]|uniref:hypothetical protein n=1 Tax=Candidatus Phytoplasma stylosanthis TaxID=2798314 RepID=UPI0029396A36|nr:hypothetical protein [Candidatus Phytoplasma stylosanthis]MDV3167959.1 hypothetical protein [Candidatus Phytoplasma stylosanthis]MDV3171051.1 hypothetical protein [Candidatus Phytoplasma stylosanthis]MDV3173660.1 hypothetical protein [Candidatus Phytoplasma stylosanthis]MDV3174227.1 hypothetical protein [Candidatus Phytoplasma stylosanthis]MDV3202716.1 hypothetical protein [Candidatus Phytoplasma stylosanthis]